MVDFVLKSTAWFEIGLKVGLKNAKMRLIMRLVLLRSRALLLVWEPLFMGYGVGSESLVATNCNRLLLINALRIFYLKFFMT